MNGLAAVVTTIQAPTAAMISWAETLHRHGAPLIVVGDEKSPPEYSLEHAQFLSVSEQSSLPFDLTHLLPLNHYARKNLGYLVAMSLRPTCIYETDDDNQPMMRWGPRTMRVSGRLIETSGWTNVYRFFTREAIWPRGLPLSAIDTPPSDASDKLTLQECPVQQGLANHSPDVDAIWRLLFDREIFFEDELSVVLAPGAWCPFNSQSTWWWPTAWPLMYLPSTCSFRLTDIWRSFVAQRILWEMGWGVAYHAAEVHQDRNEHDLVKDLRGEFTGYSKNASIAAILGDVNLASDRASIGRNMTLCYRALVHAGCLDETELDFLSRWLSDVDSIRSEAPPV